MCNARGSWLLEPRQERRAWKRQVRHGGMVLQVHLCVCVLQRVVALISKVLSSYNVLLLWQWVRMTLDGRTVIICALVLSSFELEGELAGRK